MKLRIYVLAAFAVVVAFGLTWQFKRFIAPATGTLFLLAVVLAAVYGGRLVGLLASLASILLNTYFFMEPLYSFKVDKTSDWLQLIVLALTVLVIDWLNCARQSARQETVLRQVRESRSMLKVLNALLPVCPACMKIRNSRGEWVPIETYIAGDFDAAIQKGLCPACQQFIGSEQLPSAK